MNALQARVDWIDSTLTDPATGLATIRGAIGSEEYTIESSLPEDSSRIVQATGLYEQTSEIKRAVSNIANGPWSVTTSIILQFVEELSVNNPIPYEWKETMMILMLRDATERVEMMSPLRTRACWTRLNKGSAQLLATNTISMMRGTTSTGQLVAMWAHTMQNEVKKDAIFEVLSYTDPVTLGGIGCSDDGELELAHKGVLQEVRKAGSVTELALVTYSAAELDMSLTPQPAYLQAIKNPFDTKSGKYGKFQQVLSYAGQCPDTTITQMLNQTFSKGSYAIVLYNSPGAEDYWHPAPTPWSN
ncbi:MAG: hypothetical protein LBJ69_02775 [Holosporales bacterium]|jgi:hypothetical protein|nr:hypothetical protein [Holosporales bacterium]